MHVKQEESIFVLVNVKSCQGNFALLDSESRHARIHSVLHSVQA